MIYELTIENNRDKTVIDFLKQLDFVKIKKITKNTQPQKTKPKQEIDFPYFGAAPDWDIEASELRKKNSKSFNKNIQYRK